MSNPVLPHSTSRPAHTGHSRNVVLAWLAVAMIPVAFVLAMAVGEGLIDAAGYPSGGDEVAPLGTALLIGGPVTLMAMIPGVFAVLFGRRARREGSSSATVALALGWASLIFWAGTAVLGLASRLFT